MRKAFIEILNKKCLDNSNGRRGLKLDPETQNAIELVCQYFNRESAFESAGYSFSKGLWLMGNFGSGKTQLIETYREMQKRAGVDVGLQSCNDMNMRFLKKDEFTNKIASYDGIRTYTNKFDKMERIFDDLGEEETTIMEYGNKVCIMAHILSERYKGSKSGCITHITTNLSKRQINEVYGGRIESRINEMFNLIILGGKSDAIDYRKYGID